MSEDVVFKGSRTGLQLVMNEGVEFSHIIEQLKIKLESAVNFFGKGTTVNVDADRITREQELELVGLFARYGLALKAVSFQSVKLAPGDAKPAQEGPAEEEETVVIDKTVRGGQEVICRGSVVICGNVNPGAKIIAGGNIEVKGACRGIVHAGAFGDVNAVVVADQMLAMQIRIAGLIARAPDQLERAVCAEYACIKDGNIVIEPLNNGRSDH